MDKSLKISYIIPCYGSEKTVAAVVSEIVDTVTKTTYDYEIILVNDCSPDNVYNVIQQLACESDKVTGVSFSKNFGQHAALLAGLNQSTGDVVVCLDDDGQTPANESLNLVEALFSQNADVAYASYKWAHKKHSFFRRFGSNLNEFMLEKMLGKAKGLEMTSFFAARRFVAEEICKYTNSYPYIMGLVLRTTKNIINVPVTHRLRSEGASGYNLFKLLKLWMNGFTAFSVFPLRLASFLGFLTAGSGFAYMLFLIVKKILIPDVPLGYSSIMAVILFVGGVIMLMLGMIGEYIGRMYISMNKSPQYVVRHTTHDKED